MKQITWILFTLFRKVFGLFWFWVVFPFRGYARSVVQNYALSTSNNVRIKRLDERTPEPHTRTFLGEHTKWWVLVDVHNVGRDGRVKYRKVSAIKFWLVVFLIWGWLDDDSNHDTYDAGHCKRYTEGDLQNSIMARLFRKQLLKAIEDATYGNAFDLGDLRAETPNFNFIAVLIWNGRNTAYNFYYLFGEK